MKTVTMILVLLLAGLAHADSLSVTNTAFGTGIEDHTITGVDTTFSRSVGRLYFWALIADAGAGDTVYHCWIIRNWVAQRIAIPVQGKRFRTHSVKTLDEQMTGRWIVKVEDRHGRVLSADSVTVRPD